MLSRFHLVPERNEQTDGQTDRYAISKQTKRMIYPTIRILALLLQDNK